MNFYEMKVLGSRGEVGRSWMVLSFLIEDMSIHYRHLVFFRPQQWTLPVLGAHESVRDFIEYHFAEAETQRAIYFGDEAFISIRTYVDGVVIFQIRPIKCHQPKHLNGSSNDGRKIVPTNHGVVATEPQPKTDGRTLPSKT